MVPSSDSGRHSTLLACAPPQMPFKRGVKTEIMCLSHKQQAGNQLAAGMMKAVPWDDGWGTAHLQHDGHVDDEVLDGARHQAHHR